jgi:hypothetical protein
MMEFDDFWRVIEVNFKAVFSYPTPLLSTAYVSNAQDTPKDASAT